MTSSSPSSLPSGKVILFILLPLVPFLACVCGLYMVVVVVVVLGDLLTNDGVMATDTTLSCTIPLSQPQSLFIHFARRVRERVQGPQLQRDTHPILIPFHSIPLHFISFRFDFILVPCSIHSTTCLEIIHHFLACLISISLAFRSRSG